VLGEAGLERIREQLPDAGALLVLETTDGESRTVAVGWEEAEPEAAQ
jgi:hypothetical protein